MSTSPSNQVERRFSDFLRRSLARLDEECPAAYLQMCRKAPATVSIDVDGDEVMMSFAPTAIRCVPSDGAPAVRLVARRSAILALVAGECSLLDALLDGSCAAFGSVNEIAAFHDVLVAYVQGAVRSPSFPWLLREYKGEPHEQHV